MPVKAEGEQRGFCQQSGTLLSRDCSQGCFRDRSRLRKERIMKVQTQLKGDVLKNEVQPFSRDKYSGGQQAVTCTNSVLVNN